MTGPVTRRTARPGSTVISRAHANSRSVRIDSHPSSPSEGTSSDGLDGVQAAALHGSHAGGTLRKTVR
ncbi:hypothetical protein GCM10025734_07790 [Kitasatospora paranensis]